MNINILNQAPLFKGINDNEIKDMLVCLNAAQKSYKKNEGIFISGEIISSVGIVLSGKVHIIEEDIMGRLSIITELKEGDIFGESYSINKNPLLVSVISAGDSSILFISYDKIINKCSNACLFHSRLIENMIFILANKNIMLNQKIRYITKRSIRQKLLTYLSDKELQNKSPEFDIPLNRQNLADYLCVDRSALSNELCKLRDEGIIKFNKNHFKLIK